MESSGMSTNNGSMEIVEESFSERERENDARTGETFNQFPREENISSEVPETSDEYDAGSTKSDAPNIGNANEPTASKVAGNSKWVPEAGMVFCSEDEAYVFYNTYAFRLGFSVRKGHLGRRNDGSIRDRFFLCSNEGTRQKHRTHETKKPRANVRTNCMARVELKVSRDGLWLVNKIIYEHNHPLTPPSNAHLLRSHRKLFLSQEGQTDEMDEFAGIPAYDVSAEEAYDTEKVTFHFKDHCSYLHANRMRELEKRDVQTLLDFLKAKQLEDPSFFYAIQLDVNEQVTNFFWADARSIIDYTYFGDVVMFDTTYRASKKDLPFAPFIGVNHHKQIVVFGAALLLDETTESFIWLFKTFLLAMSGQQPKTIFTDQCAALSRAICMTLPDTSHCLCLWHILQNANEHLFHPCSSDPNFQTDFRNCIYENSSEEGFHTGWGNLISKYDLADNSWLRELYAARDKWALVYHRESFSATMITMQWNDNLKSHFRKNLNRKLPLSKFLEQYNKALVRFREKELYEDYQSRQTKPVLFVDMPMLNQAAESYTRLIYMDFEHEFKSQLSCLCEPIGTSGTVYTFRVSVPEKGCYGLVEFNPTSFMVRCSCKKFETGGILCMHSLKVLNNNNVLHLPQQYIVKRWTKYANDGVAFDRYQSSADVQEPISLQYSRVCHKAIIIAVKSAFSQDAIDIFERELDKLTVEVENVLHNTPLRQEQDLNVVDILQQHTLETNKKKQGQKGQLKDGVERRRNRKSVADCNSKDALTMAQPSQGEKNGSLAELVGQDSHCQPNNRDSATAYGNGIQVQSDVVSGCTSFPPEVNVPSQDSCIPSEGVFDPAVASRGANTPTIPWPRSSIGMPISFVHGQPNNFFSWAMQPSNAPKISLSQNHPDEQTYPTVPSHHQPHPRKIQFDINKG